MAGKKSICIRASALAGAALLALTGCSSGSAELNYDPGNRVLNENYTSSAKYSETFGDGYELVAENEGYRLFMRQEDLAITVVDRLTGKYMESSPGYDDGRSNAMWRAAMKSAGRLFWYS